MPKHIPARFLLSRLSSFLLLFLISSCSQSPTPPLVLTATPPPPATETLPADPSLPSETPTLVSTATPVLERALYVLDMQLNYAARAANVDQVITYPNWTGETLTNLVLAVEPNLWSGGFSLKSITIDGQLVSNYTL
ncbi:MAG: hypothetical protein EHM40_01850, partial [Chloroflexi bacterium]